MMSLLLLSVVLVGCSGQTAHEFHRAVEEVGNELEEAVQQFWECIRLPICQ